MRKHYADEPDLAEIIRHYDTASDSALAVEDDAAARVALAAPELLIACKIALETLAPRRAALRGRARPAAVVARTLRSAIAKAEGRRPSARRKSG